MFQKLFFKKDPLKFPDEPPQQVKRILFLGDWIMTEEYDLVIIGTGAAGVSAATTAVHLGAFHIAVVERGPLWVPVSIPGASRASSSLRWPVITITVDVIILGFL